MNSNLNMGLKFNNTYEKLPKKFYTHVNLNPVKSPKLVIFNYPLANSLGLNSDLLTNEDGVSILAGNKLIDGGSFISQAYCGHQFGHFTMLGDGRAMLIGEHITPEDKRVDIQLKGSGRTPYSRNGDGRAVLSPMLREYIISEAMYFLKVPTTRSLAVVETGEYVIREDFKKGAILTRIASSHIRFGTFEYASRFTDFSSLKKLADYAIDRHYPYIKDNSENIYLDFLREVIKSHAILVAKWQSIGFIHGVMNTDNMTISGETIDYGPCAFMDIYNPDTVFSSIDTHGRYAYKNQPKMATWNLCRFAETLLPLISNNSKESIELAQECISKFHDIYYSEWLSIMRKKIGISNEEANDESLIKDLLSMMEKYKQDYTNTFINLTLNNITSNEMFDSDEFKNWYKIWQERLKGQGLSYDSCVNLIKSYNPSIIPRNHLVEKALSNADNGDLSFFKTLLDIFKNPYEYSDTQLQLSKDLPVVNKCYRTYCGT